VNPTLKKNNPPKCKWWDTVIEIKNGLMFIGLSNEQYRNLQEVFGISDDLIKRYLTDYATVCQNYVILSNEDDYRKINFLKKNSIVTPQDYKEYDMIIAPSIREFEEMFTPVSYIVSKNRHTRELGRAIKEGDTDAIKRERDSLRMLDDIRPPLGNTG
jgi:hypothetical protein